jgi:hypothetical protein
MDRERALGLGIVREKVEHKKTPGRVSSGRCGEIEDNMSRKQTVLVANAKLIGSFRSRTLRPQEGNTSNTA